MVIGKGAAMLRRISTEARGEIEALCDAPVFLELWVKVRPKWRKKDADLRRFGFKPPK
jgi:GTP-binding protein Era